MKCVGLWAIGWTLLGFLHAAENRTRVTLLLDADVARPGDKVMAGILLRMDSGWHTYWRNGGDSGDPTRVEWQLPSGTTAGEIQWPVPDKYDLEGLVTYVLHDEALLMVPITLGSNLAQGPLQITAKVSWLECEKSCVPGRSDVAATLTLGSEFRPSGAAPRFQAAKLRLPKAGMPSPPAVRWEDEATGEERSVVFQWADNSSQTRWDFYPYTAEGYEVGSATADVTSSGQRVGIRKSIRKLAGNWPSALVGIWVVRDAAGAIAQAYEVNLPIAPGTNRLQVGPGASALTAAPAQPERSLGLMMLFAFVGGLILNVMPCVLPVVALKILGFVGQGGATRARTRQLGLVYGLGVLASFLVLAGLAIAAQKAGENAGWGMAFRNPSFRLAMTVLVTLVALNLFGVFEVVFGGRAMGAAGDLASREGSAGAFFNGVLATVLATPCTAPFLSVALAFAFSQPPSVVILMFMAVGVGLAAPFVVLCWEPAWLRLLPRPGLWMERFKVAMGFPMLATAVWLFWSTAPRYGKSGVLWLGLFLVVLSAAAWVWGQFVQRGGSRRWLGRTAAFVLLGLGYFSLLEGQLQWRSPRASEAGSVAGLTEVPGGIPWERWSPEAVSRARAEGRPVLVDFTADTCLNCQLNKKTSLEIEPTRRKLREINAVALLGDYTDEDPAIASELKRFGRPGVPLVLVYPADPSAEPIVLPELLTPGLVLDALSRAAPKKG